MKTLAIRAGELLLSSMLIAAAWSPLWVSATAGHTTNSAPAKTECPLVIDLADNSQAGAIVFTLENPTDADYAVDEFDVAVLDTASPAYKTFEAAQGTSMPIKWIRVPRPADVPVSNSVVPHDSTGDDAVQVTIAFPDSEGEAVGAFNVVCHIVEST